MSVKSWRLPVAWLHPPKTGSSFGLTVYRHACAHIPEDADVGCLPPIFGLTQPFPIRQHCVGGFTSSYRVDMHHPSNLIEDYGRFLAMLRAPEGVFALIRREVGHRLQLHTPVLGGM